MPPGIRPGVVVLSTPFSTALRTRPSTCSPLRFAFCRAGWGPAVRRDRPRSCRRCPPRRGCGRCRSWSGRGSGRSSRSAGTFWAPLAASPPPRKASHGITTARTTTTKPKTMKVFLLICARRHGTRGTSGAARTRRSAVSAGISRAVADQVHVQLVGVLGGTIASISSWAVERGLRRKRPVGRRPGGRGRRPGSRGCPR